MEEKICETIDKDQSSYNSKFSELAALLAQSSQPFRNQVDALKNLRDSELKLFKRDLKMNLEKSKLNHQNQLSQFNNLLIRVNLPATSFRKPEAEVGVQ